MNDRFGEMCSIRKRATLRMRTFSAIANAASANGGFVRIADLRPPTEFAGAANGSFDGLRRSISIED